jgi:hypothetical protein
MVLAERYRSAVRSADRVPGAPRQRGSTVVEERRPVERRVYDDQPPV